MSQLLDSLINGAMLQLQDINYWKLFFVTYFLTAIAKVMGKCVALRENNKVLNTVANAFYEGAMHGISETWPISCDVYTPFIRQHKNALRVAKETKSQCWVSCY